MNEAAKQFITYQNSKTLTPLEYKQEITMTQNLNYLCYHSHEISLSTILYFSVNGLIIKEDGDYCLFIFSDASPVNKSEMEGKALTDRSFSYLPVLEVIKQVFWGHHIFHYTQMDGELFVLFSFPHGTSQFPPKDFYHLLTDRLHKIISDCKQLYDIEVAVYRSDIIHGIRPISAQYQKLLQQLQYHRFMGYSYEHSVITYSRPDGSPALPDILQEQAQKIAQTMKDKKDYSAVLNESVSIIEKASLHSIEELKIHVAHFITNQLYHAFLEKGIPMELEKTHKELSGVLENVWNWSEFTEWLSGFLGHLYHNFVQKSSFANYGKIEQIKTYIDTHYDDVNLSVLSISNIYHMNQSALSTGFKKLYQIPVSDYIQQKRIDASEKLLVDTDIPISRIYGQCGFGSSETFYRAFRKIHGITPSAYRNRKKEESANADSFHFIRK